MTVSARLVALVAGMVALMVGVGGAGTASAAIERLRAPGVVVVGAPGLRWDDVSPDRTPNLWSLVQSGATGSLSDRAARPVTCPLDGWVSLGAGNRARGPAGSSDRCPDDAALLQRPLDQVMDRLARDNRHLPFDARPGALGEVLHAAGRCTGAVGSAYAAVAAADPRGRVDVRSEDPGDRSAYRCPLTVVSADGFLDHPQDRAAAAADVDRTVGRVLAARPAGSLLLVTGVSAVAAERPHLRVAALAGAGTPRADLVSASTRRAPFVQLIDVAPTVLDALGLPTPTDMAGLPVRPTGDGTSDMGAQVRRLVDLDRAAQEQRKLVPPFFAVLVLLQVALYGLAFLALRRARRPSTQRRVLRLTRAAAVVGASGLVATYLANAVPWWRAEHPLGALCTVVVLVAVCVGALALLGPWRRDLLGPALVVAAVTFGVLVGDLVTGAHLQLNSLAGYSPLVAGRFVGIGNVAFGVFATAALLVAAMLATRLSRRRAVLAVAAVGVVAVVVDGSPAWGDDFGGVLALVPAFALLVFRAGGYRLTLRRVVWSGVAAVVAVSAFALADYARPADEQSHLGRFVGQLLHGGAGTVVARKAHANVELLTHSVLTLLVPLAILLLAFVLLRPNGGLQAVFEREPLFREGLVAVLVMGVVGFLVNDSGVAVPALAMTVAIPLAIAVSANAVRAGPADDAPLGVGTRGGSAVLP